MIHRIQCSFLFRTILPVPVAILSFLGCCSFVASVSAQQTAPQPDKFHVADGFTAELVYGVPKEFGSWVSMTTSPMGLIASDQYGKLYVIEPGADPASTSVSAIDVELGRAQGLLWAFDCLYVMAHPDKETKGGLYRVSDTDSDGKLDHAVLLREITGGGEHGPHAIILSPDGKSLYVCAGNHTPLPEIQSSRVPMNWQEDNLLSRMWDPGGHAVGIMAPGGWICKTDPNGKDFELISIGYRNQYDIAFDANGELFTYDADMEWDIGTPWYRPTRVCHVTAGSEFGWRGGDAKWPIWYPDSVPPVIEIGPGSPTGIVFGTGANYPEKFQRALFIADWSFGFIYAVHLSPDGGTWTAEKELFCSAPALQVTDMIIHEGALYFAIGGRRTQSALYRIVANEPAKVVDTRVALTPEQELRRVLENSNSEGSLPTIETCWKNLGHEDRSIRYAARIVLEKSPPESWATRVLTETNPQMALEGLLAASRLSPGEAPPLKNMLKAIEVNLPWTSLSEAQQLHLLRVCGLLKIRQDSENGDSGLRESLIGLFAEHYPNESVLLNRELCRLLVSIGDEEVVSKTIALIDAAVTQEEQIHYVMCLRLARNGWTRELRQQYLQWFVKSAVFQGGKSFAGYLKNARDEFIKQMPADEKSALASLIEMEMVEQDPYAVLKSRATVRDWTMSDLMPAVTSADLANRDIENGRKIFAMAQCYKCHQFSGSGGIVGPDLTGLSRRYTTQYLLETLIDPNKEISDQYQATIFEMADGRLIVGRVANLTGDNYLVQENMIAPGKLTTVNRNDIDSSRPSRISPMPDKLLNSFTQEEILDLLGYLKSADAKMEQ